MADSGSDQTIPLNQFQNDYFKTLNEFRKKNLFCDVTLEVDGKRFPCHRLVLITATTYFQTMFNGNFKESASNIVIMEQITKEIMDQILNAIYTAEIRLTSENTYYILKASHFLQVNGIIDTCIAYIVRNPRIHYLIDTCLFAKIIGQESLYESCARAIANDLISLSNTNIFKEIPFEIFNSILSKGNFAKKEDEILLLIMKWTKHRTCSTREIQTLLESAKLQNPAVIAVLLSKVENTVMNDEFLTRDSKSEKHSDSTFIFNLYLKAVNVKTGASGWSLSQVNESFNFDEHKTASNFYPIHSFCFSVCKAGTIIYGFEINTYTKKIDFSSYENNKKTEMTIPSDLSSMLSSCLSSYAKFEIVAMGNSILVLSKTNNSPIWAYDYKQKTWTRIFEQSVNRCTKNGLYDFSDWLTVTYLNDNLYVIGGKYNTASSRYILVFNSRSTSSRKKINFPDLFEYEYASACTFDNKIAISGSNYGGVTRNAFYIFDVNTDQWLPDIKPMKNGRANHKLIYGNGFIYAVGNNPFIMNEKYDINSNTWTDHPSLPKQLLVKNAENEEICVSIDSVLYAEMNPIL